MKLSELRDDQAQDVLADLLEPAGVIITDKDVIDAFRGDNKLKAAKLALKRHKKEVHEICAIVDGQDPKDYHLGVFTPVRVLLELFSEPEVVTLFTSEGQTERQSVSTSENTGEAGK